MKWPTATPSHSRTDRYSNQCSIVDVAGTTRKAFPARSSAVALISRPQRAGGRSWLRVKTIVRQRNSPPASEGTWRASACVAKDSFSATEGKVFADRRNALRVARPNCHVGNLLPICPWREVVYEEGSVARRQADASVLSRSRSPSNVVGGSKQMKMEAPSTRVLRGVNITGRRIQLWRAEPRAIAGRAAGRRTFPSCWGDGEKVGARSGLCTRHVRLAVRAHPMAGVPAIVRANASDWPQRTSESSRLVWTRFRPAERHFC